MKKLIILGLIGIALHLNVQAMQEGVKGMGKRNSMSSSAGKRPSTVSMKKNDTDNNKKRQPDLADKCVDCCGGCLDILNMPFKWTEDAIAQLCAQLFVESLSL